MNFQDNISAEDSEWEQVLAKGKMKKDLLLSCLAPD